MLVHELLTVSFSILMVCPVCPPSGNCPLRPRPHRAMQLDKAGVVGFCIVVFMTVRLQHARPLIAWAIRVPLLTSCFTP